MTKLYKYEVGGKHKWVTVINPLNHQTLLQACDCCGVVKSENSIVRACKAESGARLISGSMLPSARVC